MVLNKIGVSLSCFALLCIYSTLGEQTFPSKQLKCANLAEMDRLLAKLYTFGDSGREFPETVTGFRSFCNETQQLTDQFESYFSQCLSNSFTKSVYKILLHTIRRESRVNCKIWPKSAKHGRKQEKLTEAAQCINSVKGEHQKCIDKSIYFIEDSIAIKEPKKKLGYICCNLHKVEECIHNKMVLPNSSICNEDKAQTAVEFLSSIQGNLINFLCAEFVSDSDVCQRYQVMEPRANSSINRSLVFPLTDSLSSVQFSDIADE